MIILSDHDIILKLANCDLLNELILVFGGDLSVFRCLSTAQYVIRKNRDINAHYEKDVIEKAVKFCEQCQTIPTSTDMNYLQELDVLSRIKGIDDESQLFAITSILKDEFWIFTDDKRSLRALIKNQEICKPTIERIQGKVFTFLSILDRMIGYFGLDAIFEKVHPNRDCDKATDMVFSQKSSVMEGLQSNLCADRKKIPILAS